MEDVIDDIMPAVFYTTVDELNKEISILAYENKNFADYLLLQGFSLDEIDTIANGGTVRV